MNGTTRYNLLTQKLILLLLALAFFSCNSTQHLSDQQKLLRKNSISISTDRPINNKGELRDNLSKLIIQKPNTYLFNLIPSKLWLYNKRYGKLKLKPDDSLSKSVERPVVFDSVMAQKSIQNMKGFLFNQSYYYAKITDTVIYRGKKAFVKYKVNPGSNFLINKELFDVDDSDIKNLMQAHADESGMEKNKDFNSSLAEDERSRITALARNSGYYSFSQDNIVFKLDTFDKTFFKDVSSPFENAVNFITASKANKKPTLDVAAIIRRTDDPTDYIRYKVGSITVYPDFDRSANMDDSVLITTVIDSITFKYRNRYVNERVLLSRIFMSPGDWFSQADLDKTRAKLNELGIFQFIRIDARIGPESDSVLDFVITMNRLKKYDYGYTYAVSSGSTYSLGHQLSVSLRDKNLDKGADLLTISANGGLEYAYDENTGKTIFDHLSLLTKYYGVNASIDFPKFLAPVNQGLFDNSSLPHTIVSVGENVMERVDYFNLVNTSANFTYKWRENRSVSWSLSPAFVNIIRLPLETDSFREVLSSNAYLKNSYKPNFIEGENIAFTFTDAEKKRGKNYTYLKLSLEEAGGLMSLLNQFGASLNDLYHIQFAQYTKFDFDVRHYFNVKKSVFAMRFYGGVGIPYGASTTLPYIKQYFAGGPYGLRGWRIRSLGPGSYYNAVDQQNPTSIDLTGDIKLETNGEYRFPIAPIFAGAIKLNGALFADAGNIWLAQPDAGFPGGNFEFNTLGQDIAMDAGIGLRFDIAFITLRTDMAILLKKPYVPQNDGWVINQIDFYDPTWRANNIVFNVSIGYPF